MSFDFRYSSCFSPLFLFLFAPALFIYQPASVKPVLVRRPMDNHRSGGAAGHSDVHVGAAHQHVHGGPRVHVAEQQARAAVLLRVGPLQRGLANERQQLEDR